MGKMLHPAERACRNRRGVHAENVAGAETHVGTGDLYVRKWEKAESAGRDQRAVRAEGGKKSKAQVGIGEPYVRRTG